MYSPSTALTRDGVNLVSFSFPVLASSGIDAKVGSLGLVEEMLPLRERQHVQGRLLI